MSADLFACGHEKTPENSAPNGGLRIRCRTCYNAMARRRYAVSRAGCTPKTGPGNPNFRCGHEKTPENSAPNGNYKTCRACENARQRRSRARRAASRERKAA